MYYKQYGNTDMKVSAIGYGGNRFDEEDIKANKLEKCAQTVLYAHEKGINYFDTAPGYFLGKSETIFGMALSQVPRDSYFIASKMNVQELEKVGALTKDVFRSQLETTLTRLKVDYLDFYLLWGVLNKESYRAQCDALYSFFQEAKAEGLIRNIALSSHMPGNELEEVEVYNHFKGILIGYNILNYRFRQSGIKSAYENGMGVMVMNPLGGGIIPQNADRFRYLTADNDLTVAQAALRFVTSHQEIAIALVGCETEEHVDDACKAVEGLEERPMEEIYQEYENRGESINDLCTGCGYCRQCPKGIEIPKYMDAYNMKILGRSLWPRLEDYWCISVTKATECIKCGKCEGLCTQHLPIMKRLAEIRKYRRITDYISRKAMRIKRRFISGK